ncbi:transposase, IS605 OrfB family [Staphylothermus hellenicus DSM 12710]|uniref:Transposase, IS605 OrfB family n=1 Tax=Staphylothermus hellenicus (strain DSM 12710 / JCM 10830 / BK20S6-10-b1 / P8) TaxID=591019 RepID=D7DBA6_STAHD|nr:transposase, IS605 OrfB family [Staphylothermus hellenicus DSM 12710]
MTIRGRLILNSIVDKAWLLLLMRNFRDAVEYAHNLLRKNVSENDIVKLLASRILSNAHYSYSALQRAKMYRQQPYLKLKKPQLFSIGKRNEKGNRNIRFLSTDRVQIKIPSATGKHRWITAGVRFGRKYISTIKKLINNSIPYGAGVYINSGLELHVNVPLELYTEKLKVGNKNTKNDKGYIASFDFNSDRICMVIVSREGRILDVKNKHFPEVTSPGYSGRKARDKRMKALAELVDYAYHHNVTDYVAEILSRPKKKSRSKTGNRKSSRWALREFVTHLKTLVARYGGKPHFINPAYTSVDAIPLSKQLGLDIHTTSAYLLAIRFIKGYEEL